MRYLRRRQSTEGPQRERNLRLESECGMAAGEDQLEPLVLDHRVVKFVHHRFWHFQLPGLFGERPVASDPIDRAVARGDRQPSAGIRRNPVVGPPLRGDRERLLGSLLGEVEIAEEADQRGKYTPPLVAEDVFQQR